MIYIDSCIPMYLVGGPHTLRGRVIELIPTVVGSQEELVTSAEVFQEILHRYLAIQDRIHLDAAYAALEEIASFVADVMKEDTDRARLLSAEYSKLSSRDCLHFAIMKRLKCKRIWTYDHGFDAIASVERVK